MHEAIIGREGLVPPHTLLLGRLMALLRLSPRSGITTLLARSMCGSSRKLLWLPAITGPRQFAGQTVIEEKYLIWSVLLWCLKNSQSKCELSCMSPTGHRIVRTHTGTSFWQNDS